MLLDEYLDKIQHELLWRSPNGFAADSPRSIVHAAFDKERAIKRSLESKCTGQYKKDKQAKRRCWMRAKIIAAQRIIPLFRCPKYKIDWQNRKCAKTMAQARKEQGDQIKKLQAKLAKR